MRKDAVYAVLLNVTLFRGMSCSIAQDPRYLRFSVLAPSGTMHYNLRVRFLLSLEARYPITKRDLIPWWPFRWEVLRRLPIC